MIHVIMKSCFVGGRPHPSYSTVSQLVRNLYSSTKSATLCNGELLCLEAKLGIQSGIEGYFIITEIIHEGISSLFLNTISLRKASKFARTATIMRNKGIWLVSAPIVISKSLTSRPILNLDFFIPLPFLKIESYLSPV